MVTVPQERQDQKALIRSLVQKYDKIKEDKDRFKTYGEEQTKQQFIDPLFEALGWDIENEYLRDEVTFEEKIKQKRVDYVFRINRIQKFALEAKSVKEGNLDDPDFIKQAIEYAWLKGCTWAVLTNFEIVKIFNAELLPDGSDYKQNRLLEIRYDQFLNNFDDLWLLSKESFERGLLDKQAEKYGKKTKRIPVDKQLLADITQFREMLSKNIRRLNKISPELLDESVQRILDRLIFIRYCEDKELEDKQLLSSFRKGESKGQTIKNLRRLFVEYNNWYDSSIFETHDCDKLEIDNHVLGDIIDGLYYTEDSSASYNFADIEADVLGKIYEQYLGSRIHRKEQGIYYTPTYVVDYITRNTLGALLAEKNVKPDKIRVLDLACGSGSFLIKALRTLIDFYKRKDPNYDQITLDLRLDSERYNKTLQIVENSIFGVDLDKQAVQVTQLNIFINVAERKQKLPCLRQNIRLGNSLIDDSNVAGDKAFKWDTEFAQIMKKEGGFDVVIGNPPYVNVYLMDEKERKFFDETSGYETPHLKYDLYTLFIEKGIKLLRNRGYLGFIVPYSVLTQPYAELLRKYILDNCGIVSIVDFSNYYVFQEASVKTVILIVKKENNKIVRYKNRIKVIRPCSFSGVIDSKVIDSKDTYYIDQSHFLKTHQYMFRLEISKQTLSISDKMDSLSIPLGHICYISKGIVAYSKVDNRTKDDFLHDKKINSRCVPYLEGKDVEKYSIHYKGIYLEYEPLIMSRPTFPELHANKKILVRAMSGSLLSTFDDKGYYADQKLICCPKRTHIEKYVKASKLPKEPLADDADKYDEKYIVGLLNSSLMWYYYKSLLFGGLSIHPEDIRNLPIRKIDFMKSEELKIHNDLTNLVDKMLSLNRNLNKIGDKKTDEVIKLKEEIARTENEIDEIVYEIYNITDEEKKVIEQSIDT